MFGSAGMDGVLFPASSTLLGQILQWEPWLWFPITNLHFSIALQVSRKILTLLIEKKLVWKTWIAVIHYHSYLKCLSGVVLEGITD